MVRHFADIVDALLCDASFTGFPLSFDLASKGPESTEGMCCYGLKEPHAWTGQQALQ